MDITSSLDGGVTVFSIVGRIDFAASKDVEHAVSAAIQRGSQRIVFDMQQVGYISSAGLRAILMAAKQANSVGGGVAVFGLQADVEEVFTAAGFGKIVPIASSGTHAREILDARGD
jgi:anti-anti-sigma factor